MSKILSKALKKRAVKQYKQAEKVGNKVTGSWDGEIISRPKTFSERHGLK